MKTLDYDKPGTRLQGQLSPHELDTLYLSEVTGNPDIHAFARSKDLAIDLTMTNFVRAYKFERQTQIADIVAPVRPVKSRSGKYKTRGTEAINIDTSDLLSDRGDANEISFGASQTTYFIDPTGLVGFVSDDEMAESGAIQAAMEITILLKAAISLRKEIRVRNLADATSYNTTIGTDWDTSAAVHTDIIAGKRAMQGVIGFNPTHLVIGDHVADEIVANTNIKSDITAAMSVADGRAFLNAMTGDDLARFKPWGLQPVIPDVMYNSANAGLAQVLSRVWGDDAFLFHIDNETRSMTWALQFLLLNDMIVRWRSENPGGWFFKIIRKSVAKEVTPGSVYKMIDVT